MKPVLETDRFYLREIVEADAEVMYELNRDWEVIQYTGDVAFTNVENALDFIQKYDQYDKFGMGRWAVVFKDSGIVTGWCGLKYHPENGDVDLGYRFFKKYWGQGIATETSLGCIEYGFNTLNLKKIIARAMNANPASIRVMEKCGMKYECEYEEEGVPGVQYFITP